MTVTGSAASPADLPRFRYHPDPVATGSVVRDDAQCEVCGQARGYRYDGPIHSQQDVEDLCPWCIADGTAAERFDAEFTDVMWNVPSDVPADVTEEVQRRTPGFSGWQQERWLHHCGDAAAFLGAVGARELADIPDAIEALREEGGSFQWPAEQIGEYIDSLDKDGQPTAYLFRCHVCGMHLAYSDFT
jgi:uncharacterized protein CbrC (UPF0167 family)